ncbi:Tubulin alpha-6 chain, putative [Arachis hypogaea]|nr:Tubulin alpha-6 chain, putative [Arachis hypogaea]
MAPARSLEKYLKVEQLNLEATGFATTTLSASSISIFSRYFLQIDGEKPPESLFMKELKRMGMTPTSLLEDYKQGNSGVDEEVVVNEQDKGLLRKNVVSTDVERRLENSHNRCILFNSLLVF